jgi:hypothetical protein
MRKIFSVLFLVWMGSIIGMLAGLPPFTAPALFLGLLFIAVKTNAIPAGALLMAFTDLEWSPGKENMGGAKGAKDQFILWCPAADIDETQLPALSAVGKLDTAALDNIVCKVGKKFYKIYGTLETMKYDDGTVGERDGKSTDNTLEFIHPGTEQLVAEFKRQALNTPCVVLFSDGPNIRCMGLHNDNIADVNLSLKIPAFCESINGTTGTTFADRKGKTFQFKQGGHPALYYKGAIDTLLVVQA